ncbi:hypothetical protein BUALT_Bualt03G0135600 [Buddleja alternifolia]|uniref:F-box domain-containing protein n=1 Tax=Buddleja alternifolia TaxID=168488 RepID=A0AAV6XUF7_9LAMI|nr:hypothetical protein BUALT_Bualt03G0135600 [Buddleja alternifolia]
MERINQSIINLHKLSNAELIEPSSDRISSLPDSVLCHILSFLPTKLFVATSTLARRWRFLWAYVLNLYFDGEDYIEYDDQITFPEIINRVMLLRNVWHINTLRIAYLEDFGKHELDTWIRNAITRNVQALDLYFSHQARLPRCLFTCKTLVDLRLYGCIGIPGGGVCLPSFKKLHLRYVEYEGDKKLPRLISGCLVLEELIIENIFDDDIVYCIISSPTLKRLKLNFHYDLLLYIHNCELQINTPALRYLLVEDHLSEHISAGTMNSLVEANICLNNDMVKEDVYSHYVLEFFERICQVECLRLSSSYVKGKDVIAAVKLTRFVKILCHILSSLPTKASVATSILVKRWRFLWTDLSSFDFDFENHKAKSGDDDQMSIPDIINKVMLLHNVRRINTFRLSYKAKEVYSENQLDFSAVDAWIGNVIGRNVRALDLCLLYLLRLPAAFG